ncbi:DHA2 family efflux MFS transporter permease subunit [Youngiibacter fragilis]|uniref:Multidrug MFS transporter n=1 Tax=Youngiibacter fragilis 232.1 TaxID=994573 RepID=V7I8W6_9CLOT|nr:DHA2 family efflux MFS transporter permease subunit [Youngiibacter fragilis]ETA81462.1 multidrug MFS transporter [Youngiibacter fragilis 232.1]
MPLKPKTRNVGLIVMLIGTFVSSLSISLLSSALPRIMKEFSVSATIGQWLSTVYILVLGIVTASSAYLINRFNSKKLFLSGMLLFLTGCAISIAAPNFTVLILSRVVQACGAGILMPVTQVVILRTFPVSQHGKAMGIIGLVIGVAPAVGPTLSGLIVDFSGWKSIFYLLSAISIIVIVLSAFLLPGIDSQKGGSIELVSLLLYGIGFCSLMIGITNRERYGWVSMNTLGALAAGAICLYLFTVRQFRVPHPLLQLDVFKDRNFTVSSILIMITYISMMSGTMRVPIYIQSVRGLSALVSGTVLLPGSALLAVFNPITGYLYDRFGGRLITIAGMIFLGLGSASFAFFGTDTSLMVVSAMYALRMVGIAFLLMPLAAFGLRRLSGEEIAHGNAIVNSLRQMSGALGSSILIAVMGAASANSAVADIYGINASFAVEAGLLVIGLVISLIFIRNE